MEYNEAIKQTFKTGDRVMVIDKESPVYGKFGTVIKEAKHRLYNQSRYRVDLDGRRVFNASHIKKVPNSVQFILGK